MLDDARLEPDAARLEAFTQTWKQLIGSGPTLTSAERLMVVGGARAAWDGDPAPDRDAGVLAEATHWLAVDAGGITADTVDDFERRGLDRHRYLETVGVVARLSNVDFYARGLGASLPAGPAPLGDRPTGAIDPAAELAVAFVPLVGPPSAPFVLDALPSEGDALRAIHQPMYMKFEEMGDGAYADELHRTQIEYIAARTSYLNECFY